MALRRARSKYEWIRHPTIWKFQWSVSLMPLTSQFKDVINRETKVSKMYSLWCMDSRSWVKRRRCFWSFIQNFQPIHHKICILRSVKVWHDLWYLSVLASWVLLRPALERRFNSSVSTLFRIMAPSHYLVEPNHCQLVLQIYSCG